MAPLQICSHHTSFKKTIMRLQTLHALFLATTIVACGGGSSTAPTPAPSPAPAPQAEVIEKYVGTWVACVNIGQGSLQRKLTISRTGPQSGTLVGEILGYASPGCSGQINSPAGTATQGQPNSAFTIQREVSEEMASVAFIDLTTSYVYNAIGQSIAKQIIGVEGNTLVYGNEEAPRTADGYPSDVLELDFIK
jgi:hypothetical protein